MMLEMKRLNKIFLVIRVDMVVRNRDYFMESARVRCLFTS